MVAADDSPFDIRGVPALSSTCVYLRRGVKEKPLDIEVRAYSREAALEGADQTQ